MSPRCPCGACAYTKEWQPEYQETCNAHVSARNAQARLREQSLLFLLRNPLSTPAGQQSWIFSNTNLLHVSLLSGSTRYLSSKGSGCADHSLSQFWNAELLVRHVGQKGCVAHILPILHQVCVLPKYTYMGRTTPNVANHNTQNQHMRPDPGLADQKADFDRHCTALPCQGFDLNPAVSCDSTCQAYWDSTLF